MDILLSNTEFQIGLLLLAAFGGYYFAFRTRQSAVVGMLLTGVVIGPSLLAMIKYTGTISTLANLGAVVLLFLVGFEFDVKELAKIKYLVISIFSVIIPALSGYFLAKVFGYDFKAALFIAVSISATGVTISAAVLKEAGKLNSDAAKAIVGAAIVGDIFVLLLLSLAQGLGSAQLSVSAQLFLVLKAVGFFVGAILAGRLLFAKIINRFFQTSFGTTYPGALLLCSTMVAFLYAATAEMLGLSSALGAFLAGVSLRGIGVDGGRSLKARIDQIQVLFASIFFVSLGVILDLRQITAGALWLALALTAAAMATKITSSGGAALMQKYSFKDALFIGAGMAPHGGLAMIVALNGLSSGALDQKTYFALVLMSLVTAAVSPIILRRWLFDPTNSPALETRVLGPDAGIGEKHGSASENTAD